MSENLTLDDSSKPEPDGSAPESVIWTPPTTEELQQLMPQFEVLELIGCGGMGAVYKARQMSLDRLVAIKLLPLHILSHSDATLVERFRNEARLMARMNHPNIVTVHDFGETSVGHLYFIMEFVDGTDVAKMIGSQGRLPPEHALAITAHVCDALQYAHTHGVTHRDIKPGNVLINMDGEVKVADFGIASAGAPEGDVALGTPDYIAPEAMMLGVVVDSRSDLYSLGVMLYTMLTGTLPQGECEAASQLAGCDVRYDAIIARALQHDREHRYQSAREFRRDLDDIIATPEIKEGDKTSKAAIPRQLVHRRGGNAPIYRIPHATEYRVGPVKQDYSNVLWSVIVVVMLVAGGYLWWRAPKSETDGNKTENSAGSPPASVSEKSNNSLMDVGDALTPPQGSQNSTGGTAEPDSISKPAESSAPSSPTVTDIAIGDWTEVKLNDGSVQMDAKNAQFGPECSDGAIRAKIMASGSPWSYVSLRYGKDGSRYGFILKPTGKAVISYNSKKGARGEVVKQVDYDKQITKSDYVIELRAVGKTLTGLANGVEVMSVEDDRLSVGSFGIESKAPDTYGEIAFVILDRADSSRVVAASVSNPASDLQLGKIEAEFQQAYDRDVVRAREALVADLDLKYIAALDRADAGSFKAGSSNESQHLRDEKLRIQNKQPLFVSELDSPPASLKQLRATYAEALAKIDHDLDVKSRSCHDELDRRLDELQKYLITARRHDEMQMVKARREEIADKKTRR